MTGPTRAPAADPPRARWSARRRRLLGRLLPARLYRWAVRHTRRPPIGRVRFGELRRLEPLGSTPPSARASISWRYADRFLSGCLDDLGGAMLYFGERPPPGAEGPAPWEQRVWPEVGTGAATLPSPEAAEGWRGEGFDCILCLDRLQRVADPEIAVHTLCRMLRPGGSLLVTVLGIGPSPSTANAPVLRRFTEASVRRLLEGAFAPELVEVWVFGNVLAATALLHGLTADELDAGALDHLDPDYQVVIAARARKGAETR